MPRCRSVSSGKGLSICCRIRINTPGRPLPSLWLRSRPINEAVYNTLSRLRIDRVHQAVHSTTIPHVWCEEEEDTDTDDHSGHNRELLRTYRSLCTYKYDQTKACRRGEESILFLSAPQRRFSTSRLCGCKHWCNVFIM